MPRYETNLEKLGEAINLVGGVSALSSKSKISYQSIIDWRGGRKAPSHMSCKKIEKATNGLVKAKDLLPGYPWDEIE